MRRTHAWRVILIFGMTLCIVGCGGWDVPPEAITWKNPVAPNPQTLAAAREVYVDHCQKCHGVRGDGKLPPGSTYFYLTKPTDFTNARIVDAMSDGEIFWKITHGRKPMPAFEEIINDTQRWELVNLIRAFAHPGTPMEQK